ncbi:RHS repeat domain-containing protein [Crocosphaera sp. Alani8]|uniref:RHS repeat domain-containing protein n=1 Tax=Crocosphaera sp. Alani8 TaxID=3038952 RepID=UPI00313CDD43
MANLLGTDLESPYLITDENGEFVSGYVYSGSMPILRLDENGEPIYYLTDAMGSVIGLADGNGAEIAEFEYDSFGNLRNSQGNDLGLTGGDFRFQGQWLESNTDLYHFRARYYDPETGRFVSRDPVEIIEYEPESSNPYQFVYNNPHIYLDPSGEFTISEINAANAMRDILEYGRTFLIDGARDFIREKTGEVIGNLLISTINQLLPGNAIADNWANLQSGVSGGFENFIKDNVCHIFEEIGFSDRLWIEPRISASNGKPKSNGLNCSAEELGAKPAADAYAHPAPDFIIKDGYPYRSRSGKKGFKKKNPKSYIIGDIKASTAAALKDITTNNKQWNAMAEYASRYQAMPFVLYPTFLRQFKKDNLADSQFAEKTVQAQKEALSKGVVLFLLTIYD